MISYLNKHTYKLNVFEFSKVLKVSKTINREVKQIIGKKIYSKKVIPRIN